MHFLMNLSAYYLNCYFINFNFDFGVLAEKCLNPCVNGVLKFKFFFLNLSSKVLAGVRVRMSKYPYMDICEEGYAGLRKSRAEKRAWSPYGVKDHR